MQCFVQALASCACKAIFGHWSCHAKNRLGRHVHIKLTEIKTCMYAVGACKYEVVATAGTVTDTFFELKMLCLFYFVFKCENTGIISRLQWYMRNNSIFPFYISIPNSVN